MAATGTQGFRLSCASLLPPTRLRPAGTEKILPWLQHVSAPFAPSRLTDKTAQLRKIPRFSSLRAAGRRVRLVSTQVDRREP